MTIELKKVQIDLESANQLNKELQSIISNNNNQLKELTDMTSSVRVDQKYENRIGSLLSGRATNEVEMYQKMFNRISILKEEKQFLEQLLVNAKKD